MTSTDCPKLCCQRAPTSGAGAAPRAVLVDGHTSDLPQVDLHCRRRAGYVSVMRGTGVCEWKNSGNLNFVFPNLGARVFLPSSKKLPLRSFRIMCLAESSPYIFGFKEVIRKICRNKE